MPPRTSPPLNAEDMLEDCEACTTGMTEWEREFVESIREQIDDGSDLSDAQFDKLEQVWRERT
jgi:hypothetical protein